MTFGGVETFLLRLGGVLRRAGHEVTVVTTTKRGEWAGVLAEQGLRHLHLAYHRRLPAAWHAWWVGRALARAQFDVLLLNHAKFAQAALGMLPDAAVVIPVLHSDTEPFYHVGCGNPRGWNVAVGVSPKVCALAGARVPGRPIVQVLHGIDLPDAAAWPARRPFALPLGLCYVGRLDHGTKGVLLLPEILAGLRARGIAATLSIIGEGQHSDALRQRCRELQLDNLVTFHGVVPRDRVYAALLDAHLLLLPSFLEGFGLVLVEAQACGCVPVASRLEGITDAVVADGDTGVLVAPGQVAAFVDAVAALAAAPETWARMSRQGHARAEALFTVERMGAAWQTLIAEALAGKYPLPCSRRALPAIDAALCRYDDQVKGI